tara:strand:+ start:1650 stop:2003 length:354 start_codon:yes stop_codon:yes gene_type:complete
MYKQIQIFAFGQLVSELDHITQNEDGSYTFLVRDINTQKNKENILSKMKYLKKIFKKIPPPNRYNKFQKFTSSIIINIAKQIEDHKIIKKTKYYRLEHDEGYTESTSGHYCVAGFAE